MSVLIVIPARFASSRYPGKPLVELRGASGEARSLIRRSWEAAQQVEGVDRVVVATDDARIKAAAEGFGAEVVMTSTACQNGTERCAETLYTLGGGFEIVVNLQGDAPLTPAWFIEDLVAGLRANLQAEIATPVLRTEGHTLRGFLEDRRAGRVGGTTAVFGTDHNALYFSKEVIPFTGKTYADDDMTPVFTMSGSMPTALTRWQHTQHGRLARLSSLRDLSNCAFWSADAMCCVSRSMRAVASSGN